MQPPCRAAEVQLFRDGDKIPKVPELQILIHMRLVSIFMNNILDLA